MEDLKRIEEKLDSLEKGQAELKAMLALLTDKRKKSLPRLMSQRQVEDYLDISRKSVKGLVADGLLTPIEREGRKRNEVIHYKTSQVVALAGYV